MRISFDTRLSRYTLSTNLRFASQYLHITLNRESLSTIHKREQRNERRTYDLLKELDALTAEKRKLQNDIATLLDEIFPLREMKRLAEEDEKNDSDLLPESEYSRALEKFHDSFPRNEFSAT